MLNVLYDQTDGAATTGTRSQNFEAASSSFDLQAADDFVVPAGHTWTIQQVNVQGLYFNGPGSASSVNVTFYSDSANLPGVAVSGGTYANVPVTDNGGNFTITLPSRCVLSAGTYWVSVRANMNYNTGGQWAWRDRTVLSNSGAVWQNPGGGLASVCAPSWGRKTDCVAGAAPDNIFQLLGTMTPAAILYDQLNNASASASVSQDFETANDAFDAFLADDFVVPAGQTWTINQVVVQGLYFNGAGPAVNFNVFFHTNTGTLPLDPAVATRTANPYVNAAGIFTITLTSNVVLTPGTYWVSVQARMDFPVGGEWGWSDRTVLSNSPAAFKNPGLGFGCALPVWAVKTSCIPTAGGPDQVFQILGTIGGASTPTPSPTASASPSASASPTATATATPCGGTNVIVDGTFEAGTPWPAWTTQTSTNFGTPLCDVASCGTGGGTAPPFAGNNWAWFGGIAAPETATAGQTVTIASGGSASLTFQMRIGTVTTPFTDVLNVRVDGAIQQTFIEPATAEAAYTLRTINLNAFANGAAHAILFEYIGPSAGTANFTVDDVVLTAGGACPSATPSGTPTATATGTPSPSATATPCGTAQL